jgi:hypothetical protein
MAGISEQGVIVWRWQVIAGLCLINGYRKGAELGVSHGRFTSYLCSAMPDMHMTAVDLWQTMPDTGAPGSETYAERPHDEVYRRFVAHCDKHFPGRVTVIRSDTVEAAQWVEDGSLDFVFIDADHTYEGCKRDICAWLPKVRKGGLISGHDYNWPSVRQAVDEFFIPSVAGDNVWFVGKS